MNLKTKSNHKHLNQIISLVTLSGALINIFLPLYLYHLGINLINIGIIIAVTVVAQSITKMIAGSYVDSYNRKRVMLVGGIIMALANLSLVFFTSELFFMIRGAIGGIGWSIYHPAHLSYAWEISKKAQLATYGAVRSIYRHLGIIAAPILGGAIIYFLGFKALFYTSFFIALIYMYIIGLLTERKHANKIPSISEIVDNYRDIVITRGFGLLSIIKLIQSSFYLIWRTFILIYLNTVVGYDFWQAGLIIMGTSLVILPLQLPVGRLSDRLHSKWLIIPGFFLIGAFIRFFFVFDHPLSYVLMYAGFELGALLIYRPIYVRLAEMTPDEKHGEAVGIFDTLTWGLAGAALFYAGEFAELYSIYEVMMFLSTFAIVVGIILIAFHRKLRWRYGNYLRRHHLMRLYTPIDQLIDQFPEISEGFKKTRL